MTTVRIPGFTAEATLYRSGGSYRMAGAPNDLPGARDVLAQLANTVWTTDQVCKACGCSVRGFVCDCGLRPSQGKLDCIRNGGPRRSVAFLSSALQRYQ